MRCHRGKHPTPSSRIVRFHVMSLVRALSMRFFIQVITKLLRKKTRKGMLSFSFLHLIQNHFIFLSLNKISKRRYAFCGDKGLSYKFDPKLLSFSMQLMVPNLLSLYYVNRVVHHLLWYWPNWFEILSSHFSNTQPIVDSFFPYLIKIPMLQPITFVKL